LGIFIPCEAFGLNFYFETFNFTNQMKNLLLAVVCFLGIGFTNLAQAQNVPELTQTNFEPVVLKSKLPVVVFFYNNANANECKNMHALVEQTAQANKGKVFVAKIDSDKFTKYAAKYGVRTYPTLMLFRSGEKVSQLNGVATEAQIKGLLSAQ